MSDSREGDEPGPIDVDTFQEWLHYTAESRDLDEGELLDRLVSAYWVLDEMSDVVPDTPAGDVGAAAGSTPIESTEWRPSDRHRPTDEPPVSDDSGMSSWPSAADGDAVDDAANDDVTAGDATAGDAADDDAVDDDAVDDDAVDGDATAGDTPNDDAVDDDATAGDTPHDDAADDDAADGDAVDDPVAAEIKALRDSIQTQIDLAQTLTELRRQVSDLSLDVENQRSRQEGFTDRITDDITRLNQRVEQLDAQVGGDTAALDERLATVEQALGDLDSTHDEFEAWIDSEFDEIEMLFERLIDRTDDLDDRLGDVERSTDTVEEIATARRGLAELRREAIEHGIDEGTCDHCESSVDLSMLTDPVCPACERTFTDLTPGRWWNPLSTATLHTEAATRNPVPADEATHPRDFVDGS